MTYFIIEKITEHITRINLPGQVCAYLAEGNERAALIDTGLGIGDLRAYVEELLGDKPYEVILTHGHLDHAGGASRFDKVWMRSEDLALATEGNSKEARCGYTNGNGFACSVEEFDEIRTAPYEELAYGQTFDLGEETLEIINFGGHSRGSVGILFREERILLTGDACCSFTLLFGEPASLSIPEYQANLMAAWERYQKDFDSMLYSHPHNYGGPEVIPQMIELCQEIMDGKDDKLAGENMGRKTCLAKAVGPDGKRADGKIPNLVYPVS